jgi:brefeldin A-resistance guanine nucleotide exchange factor 1
VLLSEWDGVLDLWIKILAVMDRFMNSGQSDMLVEAVPESLKNILLVMSSGGQLVPPPAEGEEDERSEAQQKLWSETWERLHRFLPDLMPEILPQAPNKPKASKIVVPVKAEQEDVKEEKAQLEATNEREATAA